MERWDEPDLAETVFHELAHATLWIPGSVPFNESFASVVGEQAAIRYLTDRYGPDSEIVADYHREDRDWRRFETLLHGLYRDLDTLYTTPGLDDPVRLERKAALLASIPDRVLASPIEAKERYLRAATRQPWNNARLMQFKAYNSNDALFAAVLARNGGDLRAFIDDIGRITRHRRDPFVALREAVAPEPAAADATGRQESLTP
jgi:predicted aminopeptidase